MPRPDSLREKGSQIVMRAGIPPRIANCDSRWANHPFEGWPRVMLIKTELVPFTWDQIFVAELDRLTPISNMNTAGDG